MYQSRYWLCLHPKDNEREFLNASLLPNIILLKNEGSRTRSIELSMRRSKNDRFERSHAETQGSCIYTRLTDICYQTSFRHFVTRPSFCTCCVEDSIASGYFPLIWYYCNSPKNTLLSAQMSTSRKILEGHKPFLTNPTMEPKIRCL